MISHKTSTNLTGCVVLQRQVRTALCLIFVKHGGRKNPYAEIMRFRISAAVFFLTISLAWSLPVHAQAVIKESVPGVTNLARQEGLVACSGAIEPAAVTTIKEMGFKSIINLRLSNEPGADIEAETAAAHTAGLFYFHIPFSAGAPDPAAVDEFLKVITAKDAAPSFIHCSSGGRAATMWFIKRLVVDHWSEDRAEKEAVAFGLANPGLKQFAINYAIPQTLECAIYPRFWHWQMI